MPITVLSRRALIAAFLSFAALVPAISSALAQGLETFKSEKLAILTAKGRQDFTVELALTDRQMMQGLMYRKTLAPNAGMLFDYHHTEIMTFWMKNTYIPLDMLFIGADGKILRIAERAVPMSEELISSGVPARAVLELNGGTAERLGIKPGDQILSPELGIPLDRKS